jgi:hypothetical protein
MKYIKKFNENFGDYIDGGVEHDVYEIDDDFILKMPIKWNDGRNKKDILKFKNHINFMKNHPDIFASVKLLSPLRASIEKVDMNKAKEETEYVSSLINKKIHKEIADNNFIKILFADIAPEVYNIPNDFLEEMFSKIDDPISKKWYNFLEKITNLFKDKILITGYKLDCHIGNLGIDKNGNIKLVDF